jgi:hypothetical protein
MVVPEPGPKLTIIGETPAARCRIAEAGDYTYVEQNIGRRARGRGYKRRAMRSGGSSTSRVTGDTPAGSSSTGICTRSVRRRKKFGVK